MEGERERERGERGGKKKGMKKERVTVERGNKWIEVGKKRLLDVYKRSG